MPGSYCVVYGCLNSASSKPELSYFKLPANLERRTKWLRLISREDLMNRPYQSYAVCGEHFNPTDILPGTQRKHLKSNSLPSLNLPVIYKKDVHTLTETPKLVERCTQTYYVKNVVSHSTQTPKYLLLDTPRKRNLECSKGIYPRQNLQKVCERPSTSVPGTSTSKRQRGNKRRNVLSCSDDDGSDDDASGNVTNNSNGHLDVGRVNVTLPERDGDVPTGYICNVCSSDIKGFRSTCLECADFNMCAACEARGEHSSHYMLRIPAAKAHVDCDKVLAMIRKHIADLQKLTEEISEVEVTIKNEIIEMEEAMDEEPAEHVSDNTQSIPILSYSIDVKKEVPDRDSKYLYFSTNLTEPRNTASVHRVQSDVNEPWMSVDVGGVNDALVPNVAQASSQCQEMDPLFTDHKPFTE